MNIQQLRESLKIKWVRYYHQNRSWLAKMRIWGTYDGYRRPSSGFILATLSVLEPKLDEIFPFILELNNNPDEIIAALGLNFNPDKQLHLIKDLDEPTNKNQVDRNVKRDKATSDTFNADKIDGNNEPAPSVSTITKLDFPLAQRITSESIEREFQTFSELIKENSHQLISEETAIAQLESEEQILSLLTMCDEPEEGKIVKLPEETEVTTSKKKSNLASWIDEFCQGTGWDKEEAIFIPF